MIAFAPQMVPITGLAHGLIQFGKKKRFKDASKHQIILDGKSLRKPKIVMKRYSTIEDLAVLLPICMRVYTYKGYMQTCTHTCVHTFIHAYLHTYTPIPVERGLRKAYFK